jgi:hypothetical protein
MKKLLLSFLILTGCAPDQPLTDAQRFNADIKALEHKLATADSFQSAEAMKAYVDGIERLRKIYGK